MLPRSAEIARLAADARLRDRITLPLFRDTEDRVPEDNVGFCVTDAGVALHWTESVTASEVGQPVVVRERLVLQRMSEQGDSSAPFAPVNMDCVDCLVRVGSACKGLRMLLLMTASTLDGAVQPVRMLTWDLSSDQIEYGPVDWLEAPSPDRPAPVPRAEGESILVYLADGFWVLDEQGHVLAGPFTLPQTTSRRVHWSEEDAEATIVWSTAAAEGSVSDDVLYRRYDGNGVPLMGTKRLGASVHVAAMTRNDSSIGAVLRDEGQDAFAWADLSGERIGGDLRLGPTAFEGGASELLINYGTGRFVHVVGMPGRIRRREIACAR